MRALLGMAWVELQGYTHPQVALNLEPALELDQSLCGGDFTLRILWGLWVDCLCSGRVEQSLLWAERLLATAEQLDSDNMRLAGNWAACDSHYFLGNFTRSILHAEAILNRYDPERDRHVADLIHHDPKTIALAYKAAAEWRLGFPDRAEASANEAISNARDRKHPFDLCWVDVFTAHWVFANRGDMARMDTLLGRCEDLAREHRLLFFSDVYCPLVRGLWFLGLDQPREAEAQFRQAIPQWIGAGFALAVPDSKALQAESGLQCGAVDSAMSLLAEALEQIERPGWMERCDLSDVLRVKASALHQAGQAAAAETTFQEALKVAREQQAKGWELRAATGYARLLQVQQRSDEAVSVLQPVYDWFTEGHDTKDLKDAAALLAELRQQQPVGRKRYGHHS